MSPTLDRAIETHSNDVTPKTNPAFSSAYEETSWLILSRSVSCNIWLHCASHKYIFLYPHVDKSKVEYHKRIKTEIFHTYLLTELIVKFNF